MRPPRAFIVFRGTPGDVKVDGRVKVAVDDQSALVADVYAFLEGQFGFHRPAVRQQYRPEKQLSKCQLQESPRFTQTVAVQKKHHCNPLHLKKYKIMGHLHNIASA